MFFQQMQQVSDIIEHLVSLDVDEERKHVITKLAHTKGKMSKVESDHTVLISKFNLKWHTRKNIKYTI